MAEAKPLIDQAFEVLWPLRRPENKSDLTTPPTDPGWYWCSLSNGHILSLLLVGTPHQSQRQVITRHMDGPKWNGSAGYFMTPGVRAQSFGLGYMPDGDEWVSMQGMERVAVLSTALADAFLSPIRTALEHESRAPAG